MRWSGVVVGVVVVLGVLWWLEYPVWHGDAAIYLPYVRALWERGRWMEFNPGELSSGATSPLWVVWLAPWWGIAGEVGVKLAGGIGVVGATLVAVWAAYRLGLTWVEALVPTAAVVFAVVPAGFLGYETPLAALCGILWTVLAGRRYEPGHVLAVLAAVTPLVRPEMAMVSAAYGVAVLVERQWRRLGWLVLGSVLPLVYYGAMHVMAGSFSASGYCRAFALRETADLQLGLVRFHMAFLREFIASGLFVVCAAALPGLKRLGRTEVGVFSVASVAFYAAFFLLVAPPNTVRYGAPLAFVLGHAAVWGVRGWGDTVRKLMVGGLALWLVLAAGAKVWDDRRRGYAFAVVTERECAEQLNRLAEPGAVVLAYEVQIRYWLRPDLRVLSLDGVTDGRVAPYLERADVEGFLWRYRPRYWVANDAVWRRPFLRGSLLAQVLQEGKEVVVRSGIRFERLYQWSPARLPRGFYGCLALYRLSYGVRGQAEGAGERIFAHRSMVQASR